MTSQDTLTSCVSSTPNTSVIDIDPKKINKLVLSIINGDQELYHLLRLLEPNMQRQSPLDNEISFTLSLLFSDVEHQANLNDQLHDLASDQSYPAVAFLNNGKIVGYNQSVAPILGDLSGQNILNLGISQSDFTDFKERALRYQGVSILQLPARDKNNNPLIFIGKHQSEHQIFFIRLTGLTWSDSMNESLQDVFGLTKAESDVLVCLARGMQTEQISDYRNSKVGTVRQQIKSILQKLGVTSQVQAVSLAASMGNQLNNENIAFEEIKESDASYPIKRLQKEQFIRENRRVGWRRYGKLGGTPVLLIHGCYFGAGDYSPERILATQSNLDIIVVERPGYGITNLPLSQSIDAILHTHIEDCIFLLNQLGIKKFWLKSEDYGFVYALAFANTYPDKVNGLFAVSPLSLFKSDSDFSAIPIQQKAFIWAARHSFWLIKILVRLGHVKVRKLGPTRWMEMVFDGTPEELPIFMTQTGQEVSKNSYHFNLKQKSKGHLLDLEVGISYDWSKFLEKLIVPAKAITGVQNTTSNIDSVRQLTSINTNFEIKEIESASLTLTLTHVEESHTSLLEFITTTSNV